MIKRLKTSVNFLVSLASQLALVATILMVFATLFMEAIGWSVWLSTLPTIAVMIWVIIYYYLESQKPIVLALGSCMLTIHLTDDNLGVLAPEFATPKDPRNHNMLVINFNTHFDTLIEHSSVDKALVSEHTLQGKFVAQLGDSLPVFDTWLTEALAKHTDGMPCPSRLKGRKSECPIGTILQYAPHVSGASYLLLASSRFDDHNNAQTTHDELRTMLKKLMHYTQNSTSAADVYLPLMTGGFTRLEQKNTTVQARLAHFLLVLDSLTVEGTPPTLHLVLRKKEIDRLSLYMMVQNWQHLFQNS